MFKGKVIEQPCDWAAWIGPRIGLDKHGARTSSKWNVSKLKLVSWYSSNSRKNDRIWVGNTLKKYVLTWVTAMLKITQLDFNWQWNQ